MNYWKFGNGADDKTEKGFIWPRSGALAYRIKVRQSPKHQPGVDKRRLPGDTTILHVSSILR
jgi:hypothetical protein